MKVFKPFVAATALCVLLTGCGQSANTTNPTPGNSAAVDDTKATEDTMTQASNSTTEAASETTSYTGVPDFTTVNMDDYWISDTKFDLINYCRDQGVTIKYYIYADDSHKKYTYCLPEDLPSTGQQPLGVYMYFYFGDSRRFIQVIYGIGLGETYTVFTDNGPVHCLELSVSDEDNTWVTIDDYGTHLSLSMINNLPIMFEHIMVLPFDSTTRAVKDAFKEHYPGRTSCP